MTEVLKRILKTGFSIAVWASAAAAGCASALMLRLALGGEILFAGDVLYVLGGVLAAAAVLLAVLSAWRVKLETLNREAAAREQDLKAERESLVARLHALEKSLASLTVIREIHAAGNIPGREQRLRALLEALAETTKAFRIGLFRFSGRHFSPVAYFEEVDRARVFLYMEGDEDPWDQDSLEVTGANAVETGRGKEITAGLVRNGNRLATVEIDLGGRTRKEPPQYVLQCLKRMRPHSEGVPELRENPVPVTVPSGGGSLPHAIIQPLWAEDRLIGGLRAEIKQEAVPEDRLRPVAHALAEAALHAALALKKEEHREKAIRDGLTGLLQKRVFLERLESYTSHPRRNRDGNFALLMLDIDHFKKVNDSHGHQTGDAVLKRIGRILQQNLRGEDEGFRYGGEELAVILRTSERARALAIAERLRKQVEQADFRSTSGKKIHLTISIGLALHNRGAGPEELIEQADQALYRSKRNGRNRISVFTGGKNRKRAG